MAQERATLRSKGDKQTTVEDGVQPQLAKGPGPTLPQALVDLVLHDPYHLKDQRQTTVQIAVLKIQRVQRAQAKPSVKTRPALESIDHTRQPPMALSVLILTVTGRLVPQSSFAVQARRPRQR